MKRGWRGGGFRKEREGTHPISAEVSVRSEAPLLNAHCIGKTGLSTCVCVCVCVCVRETDRQTDRQRQRQRETERVRERHRDRDRDRQTQREFT